MIKMKKKNNRFILTIVLVISLTGCMGKENVVGVAEEYQNDSSVDNQMIQVTDNQDELQSVQYQAIYNAIDWEAEKFSCGTFFKDTAYVIGWKNELLPDKENKIKREYMLVTQQYKEENAKCTMLELPENLSVNDIVVSDGMICLVAQEMGTKTNPNPTADYLIYCQMNGIVENISALHDKSEVEDRIASMQTKKENNSLRKDENKLYRDDIQEDKTYEICNLSEVGVQSELIYTFEEGTDGIIGLICGLQGGKEVTIVWLVPTKIEGQKTTNEQKDTLTIACLEADALLNDTVAAYNRSENRYTIKIKEYYDPYQADASKEDALKRLNADLAEGVAGDMFDFIGTQDYMSKKQYVELGLFEDLNPWFDKDETIQRADYLEKLWNANEIDGKLYNFVPLYEVNTKIGSAKEIENNQILSVDQMLINANPVSVFGTHYTRSDFLHDVYIFWFARDNELFFKNTNLLLQTLQFAKQLPEKRDEIWGVENNNEMYAHTMQLQTTGWIYAEGMRRDLSMYRHVAALLGQNSSYEELESVLSQAEEGISEAIIEKLGSYAADVAMLGFPVFAGTGSAFVNRISLGMCSSSENKEGVWDFYQYLLSDEAQESRGEFQLNTFPVKKSIWERDCKYFMQPENTDIYWIGSSLNEQSYEVLVPPLTEAMVDDFNQLIEQITCVDEVDPQLMQILLEETEKYCQNQIELEQAAKSIIDRIMIYQSESGM